MEKITFRDYSFDKPYIDKMTRKDTWVKFDYDNLYPVRVLELVNSSPLQKAILESKKTYIYGAGLEPTEENIYTPNMFDTWGELIEKCLEDYVYLNAFAVQLVLNESGNRFSFYYQPVDQIRLGNYNERNIIEKAYLCTDWRKAQRNKNVVEIDMFGSETPKKGKPYLLYFKPDQVGEYYYPSIPYMSASNYIMADAALSQYYNNYIHNNFSANLAIRFPLEPTEEKKQELYDNLVKSFGGAENAGNILCLFGEGGVVPEISAIESVNADLYNSVVDIIKMALVSANRLTSPILAGISTSTGFSSKSDEIIAAYTLYKLTVINQERAFILKCFNKLLEMNGHTRCLKFIDFDVRKEFEGETQTNDKVEDAGNNVNQETDENNDENKGEVADGTENE
jgi:hypothetical protein